MAEITENLLFIETKGFSMWPFLKGEEKLIVRKTPVSDLKLGDLVLYKIDNQLVCHRLVKKTRTNDGYHIYSRGDTSFGPAELVNEQMFLGKVIGIIKNNEITSFEGVRQRVINRISLIVLPLLNFIIKSLYQGLLKRSLKNYSRRPLITQISKRITQIFRQA